jgi:hypothetical protein
LSGTAVSVSSTAASPTASATAQDCRGWTNRTGVCSSSSLATSALASCVNTLRTSNGSTGSTGTRSPCPIASCSTRLKVSAQFCSRDSSDIKATFHSCNRVSCRDQNRETQDWSTSCFSAMRDCSSCCATVDEMLCSAWNIIKQEEDNTALGPQVLPELLHRAPSTAMPLPSNRSRKTLQYMIAPVLSFLVL